MPLGGDNIGEVESIVANDRDSRFRQKDGSFFHRSGHTDRRYQPSTLNGSDRPPKPCGLPNDLSSLTLRRTKDVSFCLRGPLPRRPPDSCLQLFQKKKIDFITNCAVLCPSQLDLVSSFCSDFCHEITTSYRLSTAV